MKADRATDLGWNREVLTERQRDQLEADRLRLERAQSTERTSTPDAPIDPDWTGTKGL